MVHALDVIAERVVRDGHVAVLVSPGFGAGWSTWCDKELREQVLFDPKIVAWVEDGKVGPVPTDHLSDEYFYTGGAEDLIVEWVPVGTKFRIHEYDGSESLILESEEEWFVA